jgi:hypothetical protein
MQALLSTREENGTLWMTSESLRRKEDWQFRDLEQSYCYSPTLGWIPGNDKYRFVAVPTGRAFFSSPEHEAFFEDGLAPAVAGLLSSLPTNVSITGRQLNVSEIKGPVLGSIADRLSVAGYMPVGQTDLMRKRRRSGALVLADNTMAVAGSDFKQEAVMRVARRVSLKIRLALERAIGGNGQNVQQIVENTLDEIVDQGAIKAYSFKVSRDPKDLSRMLVYLEVQPYLQVKVIEISIVTGPFIN